LTGDYLENDAVLTINRKYIPILSRGRRNKHFVASLERGIPDKFNDGAVGDWLQADDLACSYRRLDNFHLLVA